MNDLKAGLVLSGGGAKGAYHAGVIKALAELDIPVDAIAGASIGALNGAIVATAPTLAEGAEHLAQVWLELQRESPLTFKRENFLRLPAYMGLLSAFGMRLNPSFFAAYLSMRGIHKAATLLNNSYPDNTIFDFIKERMDAFQKVTGSDSLLDNSPLKKMIDKYLNIEDIARGLPLYVSVYESSGGEIDIANCIKAMLTLGDTRPSDFLKVQDLPPQEQRNALMASAALPLLYEAQTIGSRTYTDGGQGGWITMQGNTPVTPLIQAGCKVIIVTHLSDGSPWDRHNFSDATFIEIRPHQTLSDGGASDLLAFKAERITQWMEQGYTDTMKSIGRIKAAFESIHELKAASASQRTTEEKMIDSSVRMQQAIARLNS